MNHEEAKELLSRVLPLNEEGDDYCSMLDGQAIKTHEELFDILLEGYGELSIDAVDPIDGDTTYVEVILSTEGNEFTTPCPIGLNLKVMEALYTLIP